MGAKATADPNWIQNDSVNKPWDSRMLHVTAVLEVQTFDY